MNLKLFSDQPYGKRPIDPINAGDRWEYDRTDKFFSGKTIRDVTLKAFKDQFPGDWASSHYLLTDEAFAHFLPALIQIAEDVRQQPDPDYPYASMLGESLSTALCRMARGDMDSRQRTLLESYGVAQIAEIARFVREESEWDGSADFPEVKRAIAFWQHLATGSKGSM